MIWDILTRKATSISDAMLDAYLDGELDERRKHAVEAYLETNAEAAGYVQRCRRLRYDLHRLYDDRFRDPLPPRQVELGVELGRRLDDRTRRSWRALSVFPLQVAAAAVLVIALLGGLDAVMPYLSGHRMTLDLFALFEHAPTTATQPAKEVAAATTDQQGVGLDATTMVSQTPANGTGSSATATPPTSDGAPDFSQFGFSLIAARVLADKAPAMQLVYESKQGERVELYYGPDGENAKTSLVLMDEGPVSVLFWHSGGRSYSLVGEIDRKTLLEMGRVVNGKWTAALPNVTNPAASAAPAQAAPSSSDQTGAGGTSAPATGDSASSVDSTGASTGSSSSGSGDKNIIIAPDKAPATTKKQDGAET